MNELFPIFTGAVLGLAFAAGTRALSRLWVRAVVVLLTGVTATIVSGEYAENWGFALVDIGEVVLAAWIASTLARRAVRRIRQARVTRGETAG
jgi:hypothetical protein